MSVIVTRPEPDAGRLAAQLSAKGFEPLVCPLMQIVFDETAVIPGRDYQAILATSANGLRALEARGLTENLKATQVIAVGPASARLAGELGFARVSEAEGNVEALADLTRQTLSPDQGPLLYVTGKSRAGDLKADLEQDGFEVDRVELYEAAPAGGLGSSIVEAIRDGNAEAVLLYSPRTARIWARLANQEGLATALSGLRHVCLSQAVADALYAELGRNLTIVVASSPDDDAMLQALAHDSKNKTGETDMANRKTSSRPDRKVKKPTVIDATATEVDESSAGASPVEDTANETASPEQETASADPVQQQAETEDNASGSGDDATSHAEGPEQDASPPPEKPSGRGKWIAAGMAAVLLAGAGGGAYLYHTYGQQLFEQPQTTADIAAMESQLMDAAGAAQSAREAASQASSEVSALTSRLEGIEKQVSELGSSSASEDAAQLVAGIREQAEAANNAVTDIGTRTSSLEQTAAELRQSIQAVQTALETAAASGGGVDQTALNLRLDELAAKVAAMESQRASPPDALTSEVDALKQQLAASEEKVAALSAQLEAMTAQVAALSGRVDEAARSAADDAASRTAAMARIGEAIAALDAAVKSGSAFEAELAAVRKAAPDAPPLPALDANAATGIPGQAALQQQLDMVANSLAGDEAASGSPSGGFLAALQNKLSSIVKVRSLDKPDWRAAAAGALDALKTAGPSAAVAALPADADGMPDGLKQWLIEARKHAAAMQELERLPELLLSPSTSQQQ